jgi:acetyl esterase/lipase
MRRIFLIGLAVLIVLAGGGFAAFRLSPWPSAYLIRSAFDADAVKAAEAMRKHVPQGIVERLDLRYDPADGDATLDVFLPPAGVGEAGRKPVIVWIHGGAWISGDKSHVANYLRILAGKGFAAVGVNYSIAPGAKYPTPVRQVNAALGYLVRNGESLGLDMSRVALAGDSAGAQIAAQTALIVSSGAYAAQVGIVPALGRAQLRGAVLHCGGFDAESVQFDGAFGSFLRTVFWSYFGTRDFAGDPRLKQFSIPRNMHKDFPPMFISAGNADPLAPQSYALAETAAKLGVRVETLFFPKDYRPPLGHEYQFHLDTEAGRQALHRAVAFLRTVLAP